MAPHIRSHRVPCSCFPKKASLQLSSEQSVGDVGIMQLDWKRVAQASYRGCRSSVAITAECWQHQARQNTMNAHLTLLLLLVIGQNCYSTGLVVNSHRCTTITKQTHPASVQLFRQFFVVASLCQSCMTKTRNKNRKTATQITDREINTWWTVPSISTGITKSALLTGCNSSNTHTSGWRHQNSG